MKKRIAFIIISFIFSACSIPLLVMMIDYVATFSVMNSFMTLSDAIAWLVVLSILSISGITLFIVFLIQVIKMKLKKSETKKECLNQQ